MEEFAVPLTLESPIVQAFRRSKIQALRCVAVEETETTITLTGTVPSYYLKQLAQETVLPLCEKRRLVNRVEVVRT
jgi:hypothetical protein